MLRVSNLQIAYRVNGHNRAVVDGVDFSLERGQCLGLVGESGCGKSTTALGLIRLLPKNARITQGSVLFEGQDLLQISKSAIRDIRGNRIACIFQDPMSSLNPFIRVGKQIAEPLRLHLKMNKKDALTKVLELCEAVGLPDPSSLCDKHPHQLSGGQRQRVMIAMALGCKPDLLIADEPTTALDVTIQKQILDLIRNIQKERNMSMLLITHDLAVVNEVCDDVAVLYAGRIAEYGETSDVLTHAQHPYTRSLLRAVPRIDHNAEQDLAVIPGLPPALGAIPQHCAFAQRCPHADDQCRSHIPQSNHDKTQHNYACFHPQGDSA
ncbi:MAG: ABC transporter ATP-binding protein [Planctomycetes bacterium]|nr:ABC transporter ATP-binding protein [Planctomycetota bacterium]